MWRTILSTVLLVLSLALAAQDSGKRYAVLVGINDYADSAILKLRTPRDDAKDLGAALTRAGWDKVFVMTDELDWRSQDFPSKANIAKRVALLGDLVQERDTVLLFFSGHGITDGAVPCYLPVDAELGRLKESALPLPPLVEGLKSKGIIRVALAVDACRESVAQAKGLSVVGAAGRQGTDPTGAAVAIYATQAGWYSFEDSGGRNGVFTRFLLEGLAGAADGARQGVSADGAVDFAELAAWVPGAVAAYALEKGLRQKPVANPANPAIAGTVIARYGTTAPPAPAPSRAVGPSAALPPGVPDPATQSAGQRIRLGKEYLAKAGVEAEAGRIEGTLSWLAAARRMDPDLQAENGPLATLEEVLANRVQELLNEAKSEEAIDLLASLRPQLPQSAILAFQEGVAWREVGKPAKAIPPFKHSLDLGYPAVAALGAVAGCYRMLEDWANAEDWYKRAVASPGDEQWSVCFDYGEMLFTRGRWADAVAQFNASFKLNPEFPSTPFYRALAHQKLGKKDLAAKDAALARSLVAKDSGYDWILDELKTAKL
jgi:hypothetical protein